MLFRSKFEGRAEILDGEQVRDSARGEILFADYGISGPPILQLSRAAGELLLAGRPAWLRLGLMDWSEDELDRLLLARFGARPEKTLAFSFVGLLNKRLIPVICREAWVADPGRPVADITSQERRSLARILRDWRLQVTGNTS